MVIMIAKGIGYLCNAPLALVYLIVEFDRFHICIIFYYLITL